MHQIKRIPGLPPCGEVKLRMAIVVFYGWEPAHAEETDGWRIKHHPFPAKQSVQP